jgi:hypothetical protein
LDLNCTVCTWLVSLAEFGVDSHFYFFLPPFPNPSFLFLGSEDFQSLKDTMTAGFVKIRLDMNRNLTHWTLTPSDAGGSKNGGGGGVRFSYMCDSLGITQKADDSMVEFTSEKKVGSFKFSWKSNSNNDDTDELAKRANDEEDVDGLALTAISESGAEEKEGGVVQEKILERASYQPTIAYLKENNLLAYDVSEGRYCTNKLLFSVDLFSERQRLASPSQLPAKLIRIGNLSGRSDLAVLFDQAQGDILRHQVRFLVEIKLVSAMATTSKEDACERDAVTQTVGMNLANSHTSPPVILTNLAKKHKVFYIESTQKSGDEPIKYTLFAQKCTSFSSAVAFAYSRSEDRKKGATWQNLMTDFGRGPTPPNSVTEIDEEVSVRSNEYTSGEFEEVELDEQNLEGFA